MLMREGLRLMGCMLLLALVSNKKPAFSFRICFRSSPAMFVQGKVGDGRACSAAFLV